jgi:outer membrane lipoprotein-sorting protein
MKAFLCCLIVFLIAATAFSQDEEELLNRVKAKLEKVTDYKAEGRMKMDVSFIDAPASKVSVYYKSPDKFKVKKDAGISILPKGGISINLGTLLANKTYDIVPKKDSILNGALTRVFKLLPTDETSEVVLTTLFIDEKNAVVKKAVVTTRESGTYEIELAYGKYIDWGLPDKVVFSFNAKDYKLPKGITFEYEKGGKKKEEGLKNKKGKVEISYSSYVINKGVDDKIFQSDN